MMIQITALAVAASALAQTAYMEKDVPAPATADTSKPQGWTPKLKVGSTVSYGHSRKVVGSPDGSTFQLGALIEAAAEWRRGQHGWVNTLAINEAQSKTPLLDDFVKTIDTIEFKSLYLYHLASRPWLGPFARFRLQSSLLPSDFINVGAAPVTTSTGVTLDPQESTQLTGSFEPLLLRESVGAFAIASDTEKLKLSFKLGPGAQETIVRDGFVLTDDGGTPAVELTPLADVTEIGVELETEGSGKLGEHVSWSLLINLLQPFFADPDPADKSGVDLLQIDVQGKLSIKLAAWASLDYILLVKRIPLVLDEVQITNGLLFAASFEMI
jgi:hypothetical protein